MKMLVRAGVALSVFLAGPAVAAPVVQSCILADGTTYVQCPGVQENLTLATANTAAAAQIVYGGNYIFAQMASAYGSIALQVLGPDKATYETIATKTQTDSTGGTAVSLQAGATVRVLLTGTTGAVATLGRVP